MLLNFSKFLSLSIRYSSMQIKFQLLYIISVVIFDQLYLNTAYSAAFEYSSSTSASSSSGHFYFLYFPWSIPIYIRWNSIILVVCFSYFSSRRSHIFSHLDFFFLGSLISSFLSCHIQLSRIVTIKCLLLLRSSLSSC